MAIDEYLLSCNFFIDAVVAIFIVMILLFILNEILTVIFLGLVFFLTYTYHNIGGIYVAIGVLPPLVSMFYGLWLSDVESTPKSDNEVSAPVDPKTAKWRRRKFAQNFIRSFPPSNTTMSDLPHNFEENNHEED